MGLFDKRDKKKKTDDFDSPVEQIDLSAPAKPAAAAPPEPPPAAAAREPEPPAPAAAPAKPPAPAARKPPPRREPEPDAYAPNYGIDKAIELMRTLPSDNVELVVQVVKHTLESTQVKIPEIIKDAIRKQEDIQGRIKVLREEIAEFEQEIKTRREEIENLDTDYKETSMVRERLELAENLGKKPRADAPPPPPGAKSDGPAKTAAASGSARPGAAARPPAKPAPGTSSSPTARVSKTTVVTKK